MAEGGLPVVDNDARHRYELRADDEVVGFLAYRLEADAIVLMHTEVDPAHEGRGFGSLLVKVALDDIRSRGLHLVPVCPFVSSFLERHPEYGDLVRDDRRQGG